MSEREIIGLLKKMRYGAVIKDKNKIKVSVPAYRVDVHHKMDIVEDIAISYGYDRFEGGLPVLSSVGKKDREEAFFDDAGEIMVGLGFQGVSTLMLTNPSDLFDRMNMPRKEAVRMKNPVSCEHSIARIWLIPSLMKILEKNKNRFYPQKIFEVGRCILDDGRENDRLAGVIAHAKTNFSEIKSVVEGAAESMGFEYSPSAIGHPSFIEGRVSAIVYRGEEIGFFGEISPYVLSNFGVEVPVTAFEMDLSPLINR